MSKKFSSLIIVILYGFPFVYFAMYQDYTKFTMVGYVLMIAASSFLAFLSKRYSYTSIAVVGNILSFLVSFYFVHQLADDSLWYSYFKPFSPTQVLIMVSYLNTVPQTITLLVKKKVRALYQKLV